MLAAAAGPDPARADGPLRYAMHDMMPMQSQGGSGGSMGGGMMGDNMMRMQQPNQPGQMSGMGGMQSQGGMGQGGSSGQMGGMSQQGQGGSMGGMRMDDNMRMQQGSGQMGAGMQSQGGMGQGGAMGQGGMSGQMGGMMNDNMMRMMNDHMRMMGGGMGGGTPGMAMGPAMVDMTERLEGRLAFLRAELRITDTQAPLWNAFADALRTSRKHLLEARQQMGQAYSSASDRLERYEQHLSARLEALKSARTAFAKLHGSLDETQKRTADELVAPFIATF
ncbi:MAG: Spy/CpxP family protein refolding chaperone [Methylobacterium sp.]|nr:Spy/CpxP family protein refolding chaperone [Methylobacterium sp.]